MQKARFRAASMVLLPFDPVPIGASLARGVGPSLIAVNDTLREALLDQSVSVADELSALLVLA